MSIRPRGHLLEDPQRLIYAQRAWGAAPRSAGPVRWWHSRATAHTASPSYSTSVRKQARARAKKRAPSARHSKPVGLGNGGHSQKTVPAGSPAPSAGLQTQAWARSQGNQSFWHGMRSWLGSGTGAQQDHCARSMTSFQRKLAERARPCSQATCAAVFFPLRAQRPLFRACLHPLRDLNPQSSD